MFVDESIEQRVVTGGRHGETVADKEGEVVVTGGEDMETWRHGDMET